MRGGEGIDVGYWETLSQFVAAQMARTRLRERHQAHLRRKLAFLQQMQGIHESSASSSRYPPSAPVFPSGADQMAERILELQQQQLALRKHEEETEMMKEDDDEVKEVLAAPATEEEPEPQAVVVVEADPYDAALYSPKLMQQTEVEIDAVLYDAPDDWAKLEYQVIFLPTFFLPSYSSTRSSRFPGMIPLPPQEPLSE